MSATKIVGVAAVVFLLPIMLIAAATSALAPVIPEGTATDGNPCVLTDVSVTNVAGYQPDQLAHAATIVAVGKQLGVPPRGWVIAVTAALQESGLRNLTYGDRDSLGLFQQRPSQGWGPPEQILNPTYSATQFYRRLLALPWQRMSVNDAAQAVQRSATPHAYARHEPAARALVAAVADAHCNEPQPHVDANAGTSQCPHSTTTDPVAQTVVRFACAQLGKPYVWGGNGTPGFDCSGLSAAAYKAAGIQLPRTAHAQYQAGPLLPPGTPPAPGDLIFFGTPTRVTHVAISLGGTAIVHAPTFGSPVQVADYRSMKNALAVSRPTQRRQ